MALLQLSRVDERKAMKRLFDYVYFRALGDSHTIVHRHDSTWQHMCRFLWYFDPEGRTESGYAPRKTLSEIHEFIDTRDLASLPSILAYLDTALSLSRHFHGIGTKNLYEPMTFDPTLQPILQETGLLGSDGIASDPLVIDAIDKWGFFDTDNRELMPDAKEFLDQVAETAWLSASNEDKEYILNELKICPQPPHRLGNWFSSRWRFNMWLNNGEWERDSDFFGNHSAIGLLMVTSIKTGLENGRLNPS